jgi:hypothetical protein
MKRNAIKGKLVDVTMVPQHMTADMMGHVRTVIMAMVWIIPIDVGNVRAMVPMTTAKTNVDVKMVLQWKIGIVIITRILNAKSAMMAMYY